MFFSKKRKKKEVLKGINEIDNKELKEKISNAALELLIQGEDYKDLIYTTVEFGYLFGFEGHGIEALMKVVTDKNTVYFAVQGNQIMRLEISEELFEATVENFLEIHNC